MHQGQFREHAIIVPGQCRSPPPEGKNHFQKQKAGYFKMIDFKKSVAAGVVIGIGSTVYLVSSDKLVGALFFTIGLFVICAFGLNLFTGRIGYVVERKNISACLKIWLGNFVGCIISVLPIRLAKPALSETASNMVATKLNQGYIVAIVLAIFCGMLMYIAVENFKSNKSDIGKYIGIFLCVPAFILCGFEHSIADMCYFLFSINSASATIGALLFILVVSIFNGVGSILFRFLTKD